MTLINRTPTSVLYRYNVGVAVRASNYYNKEVYTCSMVPDVQSIREYQNFPKSYMLFTKVSMRLCISHSLCSAVHNYDSLCRRSSRSPIMLSILLVISALGITPSGTFHWMETVTGMSTSGTTSTSQVTVNTLPAYTVEERPAGLPENDILGEGIVCMCINCYYVHILIFFKYKHK